MHAFQTDIWLGGVFLYSNNLTLESLKEVFRCDGLSKINRNKFEKAKVSTVDVLSCKINLFHLKTFCTKVLYVQNKVPWPN